MHGLVSASSSDRKCLIFAVEERHLKVCFIWELMDNSEVPYGGAGGI